MAIPSYSLTFAGIPFVENAGQVVSRPNPNPPPYGRERDKHLLIQKQQPEPDLMDEINRLIPFEYTLQFSDPDYPPTKTLNALANKFPLKGRVSTDIKVGQWHYPIGATRWSCFLGLATSSMAEAMLEATGGSNPATFQMQAFPNSPNAISASTYLVSTQMYMLPPRPLAEHGGKFDGLYLVTLVDERYWWQYKNVTLHLDSATTWDDLITELADSLGVSIQYSAISSAYGNPEVDSPLWTNVENAGFLLNAIAYNLGRTVVRDLFGVYHLYTNAESHSIVNANRGNANSVVRVAGGDLFATGTDLIDLSASQNAVIPSAVQVTFPKYILGNDPVPHFYNSRYGNLPNRPSAWFEDSFGDVYTITVTLSDAGFGSLVGVAEGIYSTHDTAKAVYNLEADAGGDPENLSSLTALAIQIATDYWAGQVLTALDEVYPGTIAWTPDGVHEIIWSFDQMNRIGSTRVVRTYWNQTTREMQHGTPGIDTGTSLSGIGGHSVAQSWFDLSGHYVYGVNAVKVIGGIISGQLYDGGVQEVHVTIISGGGNPVNVVNTDGTNRVSGVKVINVHDSFSGFLNARLYWTDLSSSGLSGQGQLDWQGLRLYQQGLGYTFPAPDIEIAPGSGISTFVSFDPLNNRTKLAISAIGKVSGVSVETLNVDGTQDVNPTTQLIADNTFSGMAFGRINFTGGVSGPNSTLIDWQGLQIYQEGIGYKGPEPDLQLVNGSGITWSVSNNVGQGTLQIAASVKGGANLETINQDGTQDVVPVTLLVADNSFPYTTRFGRITFTNISGGLVSGTTTISGEPSDPALAGTQPNATEIDWQGIRVYHQGHAWFGPQADIQLIDTDTVTWSGGVDATTQTLILQANASGSAGSLITKNQDNTGIVSGTKILIANNTLPNVDSNISGQNAFGRIKFVSSGGAASGLSGVNVLNWQGLRAYDGQFVGPEPDIGFSGTSDISWTLTDDPDTGVVWVQANTTGLDFIYSGTMVTKVACSNGVLAVTTANVYLGWINGLLVSGSIV